MAASGEILPTASLGYAGSNFTIWSSSSDIYNSSFTIVFNIFKVVPTRYFGQLEGFSLRSIKTTP